MTSPTVPALLPRPRGEAAAARVAVPAPRTAGDVLGPGEPGRSWSRRPDPRLRPVEPAPAAVAAPSVRRGSDLLLTLLALLGLAVTGLTALAAASGLQPLVVRSGSMEPTIATGAVVLVREVPASALRVGDVAAVERPDRIVVTHRVVAVRAEGGLAVLTLQGDANREPDPQPVAVARASRVVATLPLAGLVASELTSARGGFVLGCLVGLVLRRGARRPGAAA